MVETEKRSHKLLDRSITTRQLIFIIFLFLCLTPWISPPVALLMGLIIAQVTLTLFLIGAGLTCKVLKAVGFRPLLQGIILWVVISVTAFWTVYKLV